MDTSSLNKEDTPVVEETKSNRKEVEALDKKLLSKDDEIKELKKKLSEAQKVNKMKVTDIRATVNREGDVAKICIGVNPDGQRVFKKATELTDADIKRREEYVQGIKASNARKY